MKVTLSKVKEIVVTPAVVKTTGEITVLSEIDNAVQKKVIAITKELGIVTLWEGAEYDAIGQWTDADVTARLKELFDK